MQDGLPMERLQAAWEAVQVAGHDLTEAFRKRDPDEINRHAKAFEESHRKLLYLFRENMIALQQAAEDLKQFEMMPPPPCRVMKATDEMQAAIALQEISTGTAQAAIMLLMMVVFIFVIGCLAKAFW